MQFNSYFSFEELTTTNSKEYLANNRKLGEKYITELHAVVIELLTPIREYYNKPVNVHSGFRSTALNSSIGGSSTSQHCFGEAVDFSVSGISVEQVYQDIRNGNISIDKTLIGQLIQECDRWIHISLFTDRYKRSGKTPFQCLRFNGYKYTPDPL